MKDTVRRVLWILLAVFMVLTFYGIFNAGNPRSMFRLIVRDPGYDVAVTLVLSLVVAALVVLLTIQREQSLRHLLDLNADYIRELRRKGKSDVEIADSFLAELKVRKGGLLFSLAKNRVMRYLSKLR
jgi:hypothetical protein